MSGIGAAGRGALRRIADALGIEDPKQFPDALDTGDVKIVYDMANQIPASSVQQFQVETVNSFLGNPGDDVTIAIMAPQLGATGMTFDFLQRANAIADFASWDFYPMAIEARLQFNAASAAAEAGKFWEYNYEVVGSAGGFNPVTISGTNISDGKAFDADELTNWFSFFTGNAHRESAGISPSMPFLQGSNLRIRIRHRDTATGPYTGWTALGALDLRTRVWGVRIPTGSRKPF